MLGTRQPAYVLNSNSGLTNELEVEASSLPITPSDVARVVELITAGGLTDKLARQVIVGVIAGEGGPDAVIDARGIKVVSDHSELMAVIERAIAPEPAQTLL